MMRDLLSLKFFGNAFKIWFKYAEAAYYLDSSSADYILTPHCVTDKLPWHPGFVCNIRTDRIMTAMMDGVTGAQQWSLEREAWWRWGRSGPRRRSAHAHSEREERLFAMQWGHLGAGASPKDLKMTAAKWGRKFISRTYVLGLICHLLADWSLFAPYTPTDLSVYPGVRGEKFSSPTSSSLHSACCFFIEQFRIFKWQELVLS